MEGEREERERKHIIEYIILSSILGMDTRASLYRRERRALEHPHQAMQNLVKFNFQSVLF
jgi:hypothetical protein